MIRHGANRRVILIGRYAVKLPRLRSFSYGCQNSRNEADWCCLSDRYCPVLYCAPYGLLLVMRRASEIDEHEFEALNVAPLKGVERKASSWGRLDGGVVAVDYGYHAERKAQ